MSAAEQVFWDQARGLYDEATVARMQRAVRPDFESVLVSALRLARNATPCRFAACCSTRSASQRWGRRSTNPLLKEGEAGFGESNEEWLLREMTDLELALGRLRATMQHDRGYPLSGLKNL